MNIQARKYNLIEYLIELRDETILRKIETTISSVEKDGFQFNIEPLTDKQLRERAKKSSDDYISGNYKTQGQLEKESANW